MIDNAYRLAKPLLFRLDPEHMHDLAIGNLSRVGRSTFALRLLGEAQVTPDPRLKTAFAGICFPGPLAVAAGLDKNGIAYPALGALGWDTVEVGTITPKAQPGNPKPRLFRLREDRALINRMGFPGLGADAIAMNLVERRKSGVPVACNIGPNKTSVEAGLDAVISDCRSLAARFASLSSYLVINVSSPNTARLRELQGREALGVLLREMTTAIPTNWPTPLLAKIAPDLSESEISDIVEVALDVGLDGIVATNTTIAHPATLRGGHRSETGGLSGAPLRFRSLEVVRLLAKLTEGRLPIMAVGGISSGADALAAMRAGATMVQVYTGLIYQGPGLAKGIKDALIDELDRTGATSLADLRNAP